MAFREFTDSQGVVWRAWDVTPADLHPVTRGEDFMGDLQDGWLAFESNTEKRRLAAPYPSDWTELPIPQLEAICRSAPPASATRKPKTESGEHRAYAVTAADKAVISGAERKFLSPRGREWTVRLHECIAPDGGREVVLRFTADDIVVDLPRWPENWRTATLEQYGLMLLDSNPPRRPNPGEAPQRRRDDRPVEDRAILADADRQPAEEHGPA